MSASTATLDHYSDEHRLSGSALMRYRKPLAVLAGLLVPFLTIWLIATLNDRDINRDDLQQKVINFDVEQRKQINKPKPKPPVQKKIRRPQQDMPSLKPGLSNDALAMGGLSFGVPQFDESDFAEFADSGLLDGSGDGRDKQRTVDTKPKVIKRSPIVYPELARKQGISGYVTMNVLINESGSVEDVQVVDAQPKDMFELKAESTIRRWRFEAATFNGRKVKAWALQKIVFKLD